MSEIASNRKAPRDYHILEVIEAGLVLRGTIRAKPSGDIVAWGM